MNVIISDFIYAKYTDASASTLTFTHETWDYIHKEHDENYPDKKIVGWQHTHPGYGIFLSNYDMFIQENFFNIPFQLAYVIDPVQHLRGFFQWKNGKVEKLKGFYIYDDLGKQIKIEQPKVKKNVSGAPEADPPTRISKIQPIAIGVLSVLTICLLISVFSLSKKYANQIENQELLESQIADQNTVIAQQADEIASIKDSIAQQSIETADAPEETEIDKTTTPDGQVYFKSCRVEAGDTLLSICNDNGVDYYSAYRIILLMNGIEDANAIYEGQTILLPIE